MKRLLHLSALLGTLSLAAGCALCANPHDYTYTASGGTWHRDDPCCGRVGSALAPAGHTAMSAGPGPTFAEEVEPGVWQDLPPSPPPE